MDDIVVHPRIHERHPGITEEDVRTAWKQLLRWTNRADTEKDVVVAIGLDGKSRLIEMVGVLEDDYVLIYHGFTPPTRKVLVELGII